MKIENKTSEVSYQIQNGQHIMDFGDISKNYDASVELEITAQDLTIKATCGCSEVKKTEISPNLYRVVLKYKDTHITKPFNKPIILTFKENAQIKTATIKLKGNVL